MTNSKIKSKQADNKKFDCQGLSCFDRLFFRIVNKQLQQADIRLGGDQDADMKVLRKRFARRMISFGVGFDECAIGEGFMAAEWDAKDVTDITFKLFRSEFSKSYTSKLGYLKFMLPIQLFNHQSKKQARKDIACHYDLGIELYGQYLDKNMNYSSGYWRNASNLDEAQLNKFDLIGRKLKLEKGMKVLDMGCGYGSLAKYLAETFDVEVTGVTISQDQADYAKKHFQCDKVNIMLMDYRDLVRKRKKSKNSEDIQYIGYFDRVVSIEMLEHLGHKNHRTFFEVVNKVMKDDTSIFLFQTVGLNDLWMPCSEPWLNTYIFPNLMLAWHTQIFSESKGLFFLEDWHNFGNDFHKTYMAWYENFERNWPKIRPLLFAKDRLLENDKRTKVRRNIAKNIIKKEGREAIKFEPAATLDEQANKEVDEELAHVFYRMWKFYLLSAAGGFKARRLNVWQVVFSKAGLVGGYESER